MPRATVDSDQASDHDNTKAEDEVTQLLDEDTPADIGTDDARPASNGGRRLRSRQKNPQDNSAGSTEVGRKRKANGDSEGSKENNKKKKVTTRKQTRIESPEISDGSESEQSNSLLERDEYLATKRASEDKAKNNVRLRDNRTDDIRGVFTTTTRKINGAKKEGNICEICVSQGRKKDDAFMTGSGTSLRTHIQRAEGHYEVYYNKCMENGVTPHARTQPKDVKPDAEFARMAAIPKWTRDGLLDHIVELIVEDDAAFRVVERGSFRRLLQYQRPPTADRDIPHRTMVRQEIMAKAQRAAERTTARLAVVPGQISATFDAWTSRPGDAYLSFTIHYVSAPPDRPDKWSLTNEVLAMPHLEGSHSGQNQGDIIIRVIDRYQLKRKLGWITTDNATNNDTAMQRIESYLPKDRKFPWKAKKRHVRCAEHEIHLSARHFIEKISPTPARAIKRKLFAKRRQHHQRRNADLSIVSTDSDEADDGEISEGEFDQVFDDDNIETTGEVGGYKEDAVAAVAEEKDEELEFDPGDVVGKALALVNQIRKSSDARNFLRTLCEQDPEVPILELATWVRTRWASLHHFFGRLLQLRPALDCFVRLADDSNCVPDLKNKKYLDYKLEKGEWDLIDLMHRVLQEPADAQLSFSSEEHPSVGFAIPFLEFLQTRWEALLNQDEFAPVHDGIKAGLENLKKWYRKLDDTDVYFVCLVLNPTMKLEYTKRRWGRNYHNAGVRLLEAAFDKYYEEPVSEPSMPENAPELGSPKKGKNWALNWMNSTVHSRLQDEDEDRSRRQELQEYLDAPLERSCENVVRWWGLHQKQYPTLARIARDYLPIQGSSIASERQFSGSGLTGTDRRSRLAPATFEALQVLKSNYRNGFLSAAEEAAVHAARLWNNTPEVTTDDEKEF